MKFHTCEKDNIVIFEIKGNIMGDKDYDVLHAAIIDYSNQQRTRIVFDMAGVEWINSRGLGLLISSMVSLRKRNGRLVLVGITNKVQSLLALAQLAIIFECYDSIEEAIRSFAK
jgi:anti-sigma B factor antagonist